MGGGEEAKESSEDPEEGIGLGQQTGGTWEVKGLSTKMSSVLHHIPGSVYVKKVFLFGYELHLHAS